MASQLINIKIVIIVIFLSSTFEPSYSMFTIKYNAKRGVNCDDIYVPTQPAILPYIDPLINTNCLSADCTGVEWTAIDIKFTAIMNFVNSMSFLEYSSSDDRPLVYLGCYGKFDKKDGLGVRSFDGGDADSNHIATFPSSDLDWNAVHEIGHFHGLHHMNNKAGAEIFQNVNTHINGETWSDLLPYDCSSVMHYSQFITDDIKYIPHCINNPIDGVLIDKMGVTDLDFLREFIGRYPRAILTVQGCPMSHGHINKKIYLGECLCDGAITYFPNLVGNILKISTMDFSPLLSMMRSVAGCVAGSDSSQDYFANVFIGFLQFTKGTINKPVPIFANIWFSLKVYELTNLGFVANGAWTSTGVKKPYSGKLIGYEYQIISGLLGWTGFIRVMSRHDEKIINTTNLNQYLCSKSNFETIVFGQLDSGKYYFSDTFLEFDLCLLI